MVTFSGYRQKGDISKTSFLSITLCACARQKLLGDLFLTIVKITLAGAGKLVLQQMCCLKAESCLSFIDQQYNRANLYYTNQQTCISLANLLFFFIIWIIVLQLKCFKGGWWESGSGLRMEAFILQWGCDVIYPYRQVVLHVILFLLKLQYRKMRIITNTYLE